jgi:acyl-CoA synthetase (AMP-forming)/AMP-acid ligase II
MTLSIVHGQPLSTEPYLGPLTIAGFVQEVARRHGDREAVVMWGPDGRTSWSYDALWERSVEVAKALIAAGMGKDARVGILMTNRPEYLSSLFGIALAGGVTVSLSTFATPVELEYMLRAGDVAVLLYDRQVLKKHFSEMLAELDPAIGDTPVGQLASTRFPFLRRLVALDSVTSDPALSAPDGAAVERWADFLAQGRAESDALVESRAAMTRPSDLGAVFFSSGTTGLPKGIVHAQRAFTIQWWRWRRTMAIDPVNHPVRCWTGNGFFWSGNISQVVGYSLATGGTAVLEPVFDADDALDLIERERVSFAIGRPHQWARLQASERWPTVDLSSLHYVTYGEKIFEHPTVKTDWQMRPAYGNTETLTINTAVPSNTPEGLHSDSYGQPLPGNILKIFDPVTGKPVPRGERGEIAIKGPTLMIGYIGKTLEETFDEEGYFCTGDGGYVDEEGYLYWEGRLTDMIKTGGANVSPVEVDEALAAISGIKRAQTVGIPHQTLGEVVVACVIPHAGEQLTEDGICTTLRQRLASFKVPRAILFFTEEEFPVTGSEKVKTSDLRELASKRLEGVKVAV